MDDSLTEKIRTLLADPESLARIMQIAGSLSGGTSGSAAAPTEAPQSDPVPVIPAAASVPPKPSGAVPAGNLNGLLRTDPRVDLLRALRPLVAEEKRARLDDLVRIATVASLLGTRKT